MEVNRGFVGVRNEVERNAWIYLVVTQCVVLASVATSSDDRSNSVYSFAEQNGTMYWTALSLCIVQLLLSLFGTVYLLRHERGYNRSSVRSRNVMSLQMTLLSIVLQCIINSILLGRTNYFAASGLAIANHNMFYGCWVSFSLISYLFARSVASVLHGSSSEKGLKSGSNLHQIHQFCRLMTQLWTMHLLFQIYVLSSSISIQVSPICGGLLSTVASCQGVTAALILSVFNIPLCGVCLLNISSFVKTSDEMLVKVYVLAASVSLLIQAIITGLLTSTGGLASNPGNLYISTWINTLISLIIVLRCMDGYVSVISPSSDDRETTEKIIDFPSARPQTAIVRVSSMRSSKTSSTGISEDEDNIKNSAPLLALPAPPPYYEPTRALVPMREPEPSKSHGVVRPDPVRKHSPSREPEAPKPRGQRQQPPSVRTRTTRSTNVSSMYKSIAPQPPPFETTRTKPPPQKAQVKNVHEPMSTFMEPVIEEDERRNSSSDPPSSSPGSIQDAAYYHSISKLGISKSSSDSTFERAHKSGRKSKPPSKTTKASRRDKGSVSKAASSRQDSVSSGGSSAYAKPVDTALSKQPNIKTAKSMQSGFRSTLTIPSADLDHESTMSSKQKSRNDINAKDSISSKSKGPSISSDFNSIPAANVPESVNKRKLSMTKPFDSRKLTITKSEMEKFTDILISDDETKSILSDCEEADRNNASSSSKLSTSLKNIDDYITPRPGINPDGLRSSLARSTATSSSRVPVSTRPNLSQEANPLEEGKSRSFSRSASSRKFSPFESKEDHETAVAAALLAAGSMPFSTREGSQNQNSTSNRSPVISHNSDMDSGVETVSSDSGFSSFKKQASTKSFEFNNDELGHHAFIAKSLEKSQEAGDFLDFEYRPRASTRNLHEDFSRGQILSSYFEDRPSSKTAPMDSVHVTDGFSISEPTLDNSITTTRRAPKHAEVDEAVQAALDRASEVQKSKGTDTGRITIKGHGNAKDVNDMVTAALQAASESRGLNYSFKKTESTPPTDDASRQPKKKSFSSQYSNDMISHRESQTESGSYHHC